jgi:hypothetical protein
MPMLLKEMLDGLSRDIHAIGLVRSEIKKPTGITTMPWALFVKNAGLSAGIDEIENRYQVVILAALRRECRVREQEVFACRQAPIQAGLQTLHDIAVRVS